MVRHLRLYGFNTIIGITFLAIAFSILLPYPSPIAEYLSYLVSYCLVNPGIGLVTVGICGFGRHHFKDYRQLFTIYAVPLIPLLLFALYLMILEYSYSFRF